jgi:tetratricopeptide (TPR) repeat protein
MLKKIILTCILLLFALFCFGQSNFTRGEELLMQNQPAQAVDFLLRAMVEEPANVLASLYLGIVYEQLGRNDEAIALYRRILPTAGNLSSSVANNLGNVYFQTGNTDEAENFYSQAIMLDPLFPNAYLGRANTRIKAGNLQNAINDYEQYLTLEPLSVQRLNIEMLISLLKAEFAAEEVRRILAEEEARRIAEERQRLLDSVSASLQSAADFSQGISSGTESLEQYDGIFELE